MSEFEKRLEKAIDRGHRRANEQAEREAQRAMSEEECRRLHSQYRLEISEHIAHCMAQLPDHFPGFHLQTLAGDRGWGSTVNRDDVNLSGGGRASLFSRLEVVVRPYSTYHVLDLAAKGTIRNKEVFSRSHYQRLEEVDLATFLELVDHWVLEYAELYAATM